MVRDITLAVRSVVVTLAFDVATFSVSVVGTLGLWDFATLVHLYVVIVDPLSRGVNQVSHQNGNVFV